jgi:hypothetical protein
LLKKYPSIRIQEPSFSLLEKFDAVTFLHDYELIIPKEIYDWLDFILPMTIEWKTQNPGEQLSNTFNKLTYDKISTWYDGPYYYDYEKISKESEPSIPVTPNVVTVHATHPIIESKHNY